MRLNKTNKLSDGRLLFAFWANNRGRGDSNCTLIIVPSDTVRPSTSKSVCIGRQYQEGRNWTRTSSWQGDVNMSERVCSELGIKKSDILIA